jgi:DNA-binding YbaB/EbfC family protein
MKNLGMMMQKAQEVQQRMADMQASLERTEVEGQSGAGMVTITLTGKGFAKKIKIDPKVIDASDPTMLEDLVVAAINDARTKVDTQVEQQTKEIMGGLGLPPGIKLPF